MSLPAAVCWVAWEEEFGETWFYERGVR